MHRLMARFVPLAALLVFAGGAIGCSSNDEDLTGPAPTTSVTEPFTGTLTLNGARTHTFTVTASGAISAQLISLMPDSTSPVGLSLGTWNGSICQIVLANDASIQGSVVVGATNTTGDFCLRIYDAAGTVVQEQTYQIDVTYQKANE